MPLDIKICGLKTDDAIAAAIAGGATHLGFIFFEKSPRHVTPQEAGRLAAGARMGSGARGSGAAIKCVAVTVDADDAALDAIVSAVAPDMLQLHGHEPPERVAQVKARYGLPVMKAFPIREAADLEGIDAYREDADRLLFDAKAPAGAKLPGGNGIAFDWSLLAGLGRGLDFMLSGGLDADNVGEALRIAQPRGIDVSSGVESAPGIKDSARIAAFFAAVTRAQTEHAA